MTRSGINSLAVGAGILLSRVMGFVRERLFAHYFGNLAVADAFKAALRIPNLLQNLFGEGVLSASFIPVYSRLLGEGKIEEAGRVAGVVGTLLFFVTALIVAVGVTLAGPLTALIAPGFEGEVHALTVRLVRIIFGGVGLLTLAAWCLGILNSHRRFFLSYVAPVLWNLAQIAVFVWVGWWLARGGQHVALDDFAVEVAWATVAGAALQLLVMLPTALRLARGLRPSLAWRRGPARTVVDNFAPVLVARGVSQLSAYIDQFIASYLGTGMVAAMSYAQMLYTLPVSLFGMAVSAAELPEMARELGGSADGGISDESKQALVKRVEAGARRVAFFVVPSVAAFLLLGDVVVATLYQSGRFGREDTQLVWWILAGSTVGLLAATQGRLLASCLYALWDTRRPLYFAMVRVSLTAVLGWALALPIRRWLALPPSYGAVALTATAGLAGWLEFLLLRHAVERRIGRLRLGGRTLWGAWAAALVAAALAFGVRHVLPLRRPELVGLVVLGFYGVTYLGLTLALGVPEAEAFSRRLRTRLRR